MNSSNYIANGHSKGASVSRRSLLKSSLLGSAATVAGGLLPSIGARPAFGSASLAGSGVASTIGATVETTGGKVRGIVRSGIQTFRSVPYGATTAAPYRFMPPRKVEPWTGVRDVFITGHVAQQIRPVIAAPAGVGDRANALPGDDCLTLNVFTPGIDGKKRPVMFWMHGGGFTVGSGLGLEYDGTNLAHAHDVVLVAVNHRLNVFGYLYLGNIKDERYADSGMVGMLDLVQALEWVRDNIANFGGDPGNVTIFGQSGGGSKTSILMAMPSAKGLFHRAIVESGSTLRVETPEEAQTTTDTVLQKLQISSGNLAKLQELPAEVISVAALVQGMDDLHRAYLRFGPVLDGRSLPRQPFDPGAPDVSAHVPMMVGTVETEGTYFSDTALLDMDETKMRDALHRRFGDSTDKVIQVFRKNRPNTKPSELYFIITSFPMAAIQQAERKAALKQAPAYLYQFQWRTPVEDGRLLSPHTVEIGFAFNNVWLVPEMLGTGPDLQPLADKVSAVWTNFARTGTPHAEGVPVWPAYDSGNRATMLINNDWKAVNDPTCDERELLLTVPRQSMF